MSEETRTICEHSERHDEQGHHHCNRLAETTIYRVNGEKEVCKQHAEELTSNKYIIPWRMNDG